ncbi:MAG: hypothetical protein INF93_13515 [Rhodobacter sp.]|nr:hypothetical protein [Rhodobacter sp.]
MIRQGIVCDLALKVDAPPAHHPVCGKIRTLAQHARKFCLLRRAQSRRGVGRATAGQPFPPFGSVAVNPIPQRRRSIAQLPAAALRPLPSSTSAIASMRRAALASFAFDAAARSPRAGTSVPVIATAIKTNMLRWNRTTAANRRDARASQGPGPLV